MTGTPRATTATIIPTLRYADAPAALAWLCRAFGFREHLTVPDDDGGIAHAGGMAAGAEVVVPEGHGGRP